MENNFMKNIMKHYKKKMKLGIFDKYKTTLGQVDHVKKTLSNNKC